MTDSSTVTFNEAPRVPVVLDLQAGTIGTDTHVRPLPESADAALAAYLDLVYEMRAKKGVVPLRHDDVEILAVGLDLDTDDVVGRLIQLMGSEKEARGLLERLRSGKVLIPAVLLFAGVVALGAIAVADSGSSGSVGTRNEPTAITTAAATPTTAAPATAAPVTTAAPATTPAPVTTAAPAKKATVKAPVTNAPATTAAPTTTAAPVETNPPYVPPAPYRPVGGTTPTVDVGGSGGATHVELLPPTVTG
jgi:hypothetical protein